MAFYKYVTFKTLEHILSGSIRLTHPSGFNDPFELAVEVFNPYDEEGRMLQLHFDTVTKRRNIKKYILPENFTHERCNDLFIRELISNLNIAVGFLCLTKNADSHLMWAHYAEKYSGAVIEFKEDHEFFRGAFDIQYLTNRPKFHIDYFIDFAIHPISELCIKPKEWEYEKEWRIARSLKDCTLIEGHDGTNIYSLPIPLDAIKKITLGERTSALNAKKIYDILKETNIEINIAALANWKYEFRYETIKHGVPLSKSMPPITPLTADIFKNEEGLIGELAQWMIENHPMRELVKWRL